MAENFLSRLDLPENNSSAFQDDKDEIIVAIPARGFVT